MSAEDRSDETVGIEPTKAVPYYLQSIQYGELGGPESPLCSTVRLALASARLRQAEKGVGGITPAGSSRTSG